MALGPFVPTPDKWSANGSPIIQVREALTPFRGGLGVPSEGPFADQTSRFRTNGAQAGFNAGESSVLATVRSGSDFGG